MAEKSQMIQTLELTSLPPCAVITGPFPGSLIFFSLPFSKIIFINILNGEKKGEGEEEGGMFREEFCEIFFICDILTLYLPDTYLFILPYHY